EREIAQHAVAAVQHRGECSLLAVDDIADEGDLEQAPPGRASGSVAAGRLDGKEGGDLVQRELPGGIRREGLPEVRCGERPQCRLSGTALGEHESEASGDGVVAGAGDVHAGPRYG